MNMDLHCSLVTSGVGYAPIVTATQLPFVAIDGITPQDVPELVSTGIAGVALVQAIRNAKQPGRVVRDVLTAWQQD